jgi:hypothetical protein
LKTRRQPLVLYWDASALARSLRAELPGLKVLTFDRRLRQAAGTEGLLPAE